MSDIRPRRSVLYMPGSNERALEKAKTLDADALILDLEDAVAPDAKEKARAQVMAAITGGGYGRRELVVRVNGLATPWGAADLAAAAAAGPDAILVPKVNRAEDVFEIGRRLEGLGADPSVRLWVMMETPLAMLEAGGIAAAVRNREGSRLAAMVMGTNDLAKETGARLVAGRAPMLAWLSICVAAARAHGLEIIDGVFNDIGDEAGLRAECEAGRDLGMTGKTLIHPRQIEICNRAFSASEEEIARARRIIDAFERPENRGKGVLTVDGRMVERLHAEMARRVVAIAEAIAARR